MTGEPEQLISIRRQRALIRLVTRLWNKESLEDHQEGLRLAMILGLTLPAVHGYHGLTRGHVTKCGEPECFVCGKQVDFP